MRRKETKALLSQSQLSQFFFDICTDKSMTFIPTQINTF